MKLRRNHFSRYEIARNGSKGQNDFQITLTTFVIWIFIWKPYFP